MNVLRHPCKPKRSRYKPPCARVLVIVPTYILTGYSQAICSLLCISWWQTSPALALACIAFHTLLLIMALWAHLMSLFTDPGQIPLVIDKEIGEIAVNSGFNTCMKCGCTRPKRAYHCKICKRCVMHMDHHCPWIGNCVGLFNQKFFLLYNLYIMLMCCLDLAVGTRTIYDMYIQYNDNVDILIVRYGMVLALLTVIFYMLAFIFGIFTFIVFVDQIKNIYHNKTMIDQLKGMETRQLPFIKSISNVFGSHPSLKWLLPLPMKPRYLGTPLSATDTIVLAIFDEHDACMVDKNAELQQIDMLLHARGRNNGLPE